MKRVVNRQRLRQRCWFLMVPICRVILTRGMVYGGVVLKIFCLFLKIPPGRCHFRELLLVVVGIAQMIWGILGKR